MKVSAFEAELQSINPDFSIRVSPNNPEMAGIYWRTLYVCGIPSGDIFDEVKKEYRNSVGIIHRTRVEALAIAKRYLYRIQNEPGFLEGEME